MATNFEHLECVICVQSTKIGTHENEAIHSTVYREFLASGNIGKNNTMEVCYF